MSDASVVVAVVDDDPSSLESIGNLLESASYEPRLFHSAAALLTSSELPRMDCVISDIGMPAMNGFELVRALNRLRPELPIILVTGRIDLGLQASDGAGKYRAIFEKPFSGRDLLAAVAEAIRVR